MADHSRLGRGLASLIGDVGEETSTADAAASRAARRSKTCGPIRATRAALSPTPNSANFPHSIRERGIIQPIVVRPVRGATDTFEIIAGERRWRAAQRAGLHEVPIAMVEATDAQALEFAIIENVQRADLNAIEEAAGYLALMEEFNHSQDDVAQIVGKSRSHVANMVRLLKLSEPVKALVQSGQISAGHARQLLGQPNALEIAQDIIKRGLSVRQIELDMRKDGARAGARRSQRGQGPHQRRQGRRHRARWSGAVRCAWAWTCRSITAARAARCISSTRIWISWMGF